MIEKEKNLEKQLIDAVKSLNGWCIKLLSSHLTGLPDRMCLLPDGRIFFAEVKTTGMKPRRIQLHIHGKLKDLGFRVEIIDKSLQIKQLIKEYGK
jgi:hypothetical protein